MLLGEFKGILLCIFAVEAYTASWIEILRSWKIKGFRLVEAYTASWIEMQTASLTDTGVSSRGLCCLVD